jgi:hypothetical protein
LKRIGVNPLPHRSRALGVGFEHRGVNVRWITGRQD